MRETTVRFVEYNPRRAFRGAPAARVYINEGDGWYGLWMSKSDLSKNMMIFGRHPELVKAYEAYEANKEIRGREYQITVSD